MRRRSPDQQKRLPKTALLPADPRQSLHCNLWFSIPHFPNTTPACSMPPPLAALWLAFPKELSHFWVKNLVDWLTCSVPWGSSSISAPTAGNRECFYKSCDVIFRHIWNNWSFYLPFQGWQAFRLLCGPPTIPEKEEKAWKACDIP